MQNRVRIVWIRIGTAFLASAGLLPILLSGCGKESTTPAAGTFGNVYTVTLRTACANCHAPGGLPTTQGCTLDFSSQAQAYSTLTGGTVAGSGEPTACLGLKYVVAGDPSSSYLVGVLNSTYHVNNFAGHSGCLPYATHLQDQNLTADEQSSIVSWIQGGAQNN
jgi:hypothetical protein